MVGRSRTCVPPILHHPPNILTPSRASLWTSDVVGSLCVTASIMAPCYAAADWLDGDEAGLPGRSLPRRSPCRPRPGRAARSLRLRRRRRSGRAQVALAACAHARGDLGARAGGCRGRGRGDRDPSGRGTWCAPTDRCMMQGAVLVMKRTQAGPGCMHWARRDRLDRGSPARRRVFAGTSAPRDARRPHSDLVRGTRI